MTWPARFDKPTHEGLVLVPTSSARLQDLGPMRTGRLMETDILPGSALICAAKDGEMIVDGEGQVRFAFEGNAISAVNLERFHEKCLCAAGRLVQRAPSIAYGSAQADLLAPVAKYDLVRHVFTEILNRALLEDWSGERLQDFLPAATLVTPTSDEKDIAGLCRLPMRSLAQGRKGVYAWLLLDGTILAKEGSAPITAWRRGDMGLSPLLERAGVDLAQRILLA